MQRDLNAILGHIAQLNELDTAGVPAMAQVGEMLGAERERAGRDAAGGRGAAFAGSRGGDGGGSGDGWAVLQGAEGD